MGYSSGYNPDSNCWSSFDGAAVYPEYLSDLRLIFCPSEADDVYISSTDKDPEKMLYMVSSSWRDAPGENPVRGKTAWPKTPNVAYVYWGYLVNPKWVANVDDCGAVGSLLDCQDGLPPTLNCISRWEDLPLTMPSTGESVTVMRLRAGIERFLTADINHAEESALASSDVPVIWDTFRAEGGRVEASEINHTNGSNVLFLDGHAEFVHYPQPDGSRGWMLSKAGLNDGVTDFP